VAPVWSLREARTDLHNRAREVFVEVGGHVQPAPAPRFSRTPGVAGAVPEVGQHTAEILAELGLP
jgi:alpha-methylacyl-CoA racemase